MSKPSPAYHFGRLAAIGIHASAQARPDEHRPRPGELNMLAVQPAMIVVNYHTHYVLPDKRWVNRWGNIMAEMSDYPSRALTAGEQTEMTLGYERERDAIARAEELRRLRGDRTRAAFAELLGVSTRTVESWEQHRRDVPRPILELARLKLSS